MQIIKDISLDISDNIGLDFMTKLMGGRTNPEINKMLEEKKQICAQNIEPKAAYKMFQIKEIDGDNVIFDSGNVFTGPNISKILTGSKLSCIFICTLGNKIDDIIKDSSASGNTLDTIIMDAITTEMLSLLGNHVGAVVKKEGIKEKGWAATCTYSPGQYNWTIEEQKEIFEMIDGSKIGVALNSSFLMVPFKSISAVYGFGPKESINKTRVACDLCPRENCIGRR